MRFRRPSLIPSTTPLLVVFFVFFTAFFFVFHPHFPLSPPHSRILSFFFYLFPSSFCWLSLTSVFTLLLFSKFSFLFPCFKHHVLVLKTWNMDMWGPYVPHYDFCFVFLFFFCFYFLIFFIFVFNVFFHSFLFFSYFLFFYIF